MVISSSTPNCTGKSTTTTANSAGDRARAIASHSRGPISLPRISRIESDWHERSAFVRIREIRGITRSFTWDALALVTGPSSARAGCQAPLDQCPFCTRVSRIVSAHAESSTNSSAPSVHIRGIRVLGWPSESGLTRCAAVGKPRSSRSCHPEGQPTSLGDAQNEPEGSPPQTLQDRRD